jgi:hypothetical protein
VVSAAPTVAEALELLRVALASTEKPIDAFVDQTSGVLPRRVFLRLAKEDAFPTVRVGRRVLARREDLDAWFARSASRSARALRERAAPQDDLDRELGLTGR